MIRAILDRLTGSALARVEPRDVQSAVLRWSQGAHAMFGRYQAWVVVDRAHERHCVSAARVLRARRGRAG